MDTTQELLSQLEAKLAAPAGKSPTTQVIEAARLHLAGMTELDLPEIHRERALAAAYIEIRVATPEQAEQLGMYAAQLLARRFKTYQELGFAYPEEALVEAARRIEITAF